MGRRRFFQSSSICLWVVVLILTSVSLAEAADVCPGGPGSPQETWLPGVNPEGNGTPIIVQHMGATIELCQEYCIEHDTKWRFTFKISGNGTDREVSFTEDLYAKKGYKVALQALYGPRIIACIPLPRNDQAHLAIVDIEKAAIVSRFICARPVVSPSGRYIVYSTETMNRWPREWARLVVVLYDVTKSDAENRFPCDMCDSFDLTNAGVPIYPAEHARKKLYIDDPMLVGKDKHTFDESLQSPFLWADDESCVVFCSGYDNEGTRLVSLWFGKDETEEPKMAYRHIDAKDYPERPGDRKDTEAAEKEHGEPVCVMPERLAWEDRDHVKLFNARSGWGAGPLSPSIVLPLPKP